MFGQGAVKTVTLFFDETGKRRVAYHTAGFQYDEGVTPIVAAVTASNLVSIVPYPQALPSLWCCHQSSLLFFSCGLVVSVPSGVGIPVSSVVTAFLVFCYAYPFFCV